ncbi:hypothetical protein Pint_21335 [Pistacia integerrima]|uniref:Uncharacterized protein n=1 Tax=Pistacia integerrima TaxID=434235 RepID=A0ACC0XD81_9ROSI|nr:hypothetical protein Pint_21335 [Pistacia integerrima]
MFPNLPVTCFQSANLLKIRTVLLTFILPTVSFRT